VRASLHGVINRKGEFSIPPMECDFIETDKGGFIVNTNDYSTSQSIYMDEKGKILLKQ